MTANELLSWDCERRGLATSSNAAFVRNRLAAARVDSHLSATPWDPKMTPNLLSDNKL